MPGSPSVRIAFWSELSVPSIIEYIDRLITVGYDPATGRSLVRQEKGGSGIGAEVFAEESDVPTDSSTEQGAATSLHEFCKNLKKLAPSHTGSR